MKTFSAKPESVKRDWFVVDATDKTLGRLSSEIARRLRGKHKPQFTPHIDTGDFVKALEDGGYEQGPRAGVAAVPEPHASLLLLLGTLCAVRRKTTGKSLV